MKRIRGVQEAVVIVLSRVRAYLWEKRGEELV